MDSILHVIQTRLINRGNGGNNVFLGDNVQGTVVSKEKASPLAEINVPTFRDIDRSVEAVLDVVLLDFIDSPIHLVSLADINETIVLISGTSV